MLRQAANSVSQVLTADIGELYHGRVPTGPLAEGFSNLSFFGQLLFDPSRPLADQLRPLLDHLERPAPVRISIECCSSETVPLPLS
jgi:hypothetical protein